MQLPFTATQFVGVFRAYNAAIGLAPLAAYALGALALYLAVRARRSSGLAISAILAGMWAFTGVGYHLLSFSRINPAARMFAVAFVLEAVLLLQAGIRGKLAYDFKPNLRVKVGLAMAAFAMVVYPLLGFVFGHGYPNGPVFGLAPCPLAIFTFGMLLVADRTPRYLAIVPVLWALLGFTAAFALGIREDVSLIVSAVTYVVFDVRRRFESRAAAASAAALRSARVAGQA